MDKELWGIKEVMEYCSCGRATATRILSMDGCPVLPRMKHGSYRVPKEAFLEWFHGGEW